MSEIVANNGKSTKMLGGITGKGFMPGKSGNPSGRPKDTLKSYMAKKLSGMSEKEKENYLKEIPKELQWRMAEGNPRQGVSGEDEQGNPIPLLGGSTKNGSNSNGNEEVAETEEED